MRFVRQSRTLAGCSSPRIAMPASVSASRFLQVASLAAVLFVSTAAPGTSGLSSAAPRFTAIAAGGAHTCAVTTSGGVFCWGSNRDGELGDGTRGDRRVAVAVVGLKGKVKALTAGAGHTCALTVAGGVECWGRNLAGQLGNGTKTSSSTPVDVVGLANGVQAIDAGDFHTCAITSAGGVKCWGRNQSGELGNGTFGSTPADDRSSPVDVVGLASGVTAISASTGVYLAGQIADEGYSCALTTAGGVKCWGGERGTTPPPDVPGFTSDIKAIAAGQGLCGLTTGGAVKCDGLDVHGLESGVATISTVDGGLCAITIVGAAMCTLGVGDTLTTTCSPRGHCAAVAVGLTSGVQAVVGGVLYACALMKTGGIKCWGSNSHGALGIGSKSDSLVASTPLDVVTRQSAPAASAAGLKLNLFRSQDGTVSCGVGPPLMPRNEVFCGEVQTQANGPDSSATLSANGNLRLCHFAHLSFNTFCTDNVDRHAPLLHYGQSDVLGGFRCSSAANGITCTVTSGPAAGKGFRIDANGVVRVGP